MVGVTATTHLLKDIGTGPLPRLPREVLVYAEAAVAQNLQDTARATPVNTAVALALCISKRERIAGDLTDKTPAHNRAALVAAKDAGASLDQVEACISADDANRRRRSNLEGQAVKIHRGAPRPNGTDGASEHVGKEAEDAIASLRKGLNSADPNPALIRAFFRRASQCHIPRLPPMLRLRRQILRSILLFCF
jgi:hypothetical protein